MVERISFWIPLVFEQTIVSKAQIFNPLNAFQVLNEENFSKKCKNLEFTQIFVCLNTCKFQMKLQSHRILCSYYCSEKHEKNLRTNHFVVSVMWGFLASYISKIRNKLFKISFKSFITSSPKTQRSATLVDFLLFLSFPVCRYLVPFYLTYYKKNRVHSFLKSKLLWDFLPCKKMKNRVIVINSIHWNSFHCCTIINKDLIKSILFTKNYSSSFGQLFHVHR